MSLPPARAPGALSLIAGAVLATACMSFGCSSRSASAEDGKVAGGSGGGGVGGGRAVGGNGPAAGVAGGIASAGSVGAGAAGTAGGAGSGGAPGNPGSVLWAASLPGRVNDGVGVHMAPRGKGVAIAYSVLVAGTALSVATVDDDGSIQSAQYSGVSGGGLYEARGIAPVGDADFLVAGVFNQAVTFSPSVTADFAGNYDAVFVRFTAAQQPLWAESWGGTGFEGAYRSAYGNGSVWVGGTVQGDIGIGPTNGGDKGWLARLAPQGDSMAAAFKKQATDAAQSECRGLAPTQDGGVLYVGTVRNAAGTWANLRFAKYSATGAQQWTGDHVSTGAMTIESSAAALDASGVFWVGGVATGTGNILDTALALSGEDGFLVRMSSTGPQALSGEKVRVIASAGQDAVFSLAPVAGGVMVAGKIGGAATADGASLVSQGNSDGFVARYGLDGKLLWAERYGASGADDVTSIVEGDDVYWIAGRFEGTVVFGDKTLKSVDGGRSAFVAKIAK